jgi:hypothetical protein
MPSGGSHVQLMALVSDQTGSSKVQQLTTSILPIVANTSGVPIAITNLFVSNISGSSSTFTLRLTPNTGGLDTAVEAIAEGEAIAANVRTTNFVSNAGPIIVPPGYSLKGLAGNASRVNVFVNYNTFRNF